MRGEHALGRRAARARGFPHDAVYGTVPADRGPDLRDADLTDADLTDADLTDADLTDAVGWQR